MTSPKRLARIAGLLYLGLPVFMGFAAFGVRDRITVAGDPAATAENIEASATLFRLGFVSDLVGITLYLLLGMALYMLLKHVNHSVAAALMVFVTLGVAVLCINMLNHFAALIFATEEAYAASLGDGSDALALFFLDLHGHGYGVAQIFLGLWLLPLGYLAYKSDMFPRALGVLLMIGAFTHLIEMLTHFLIPGVSQAVIVLIQVPAIVAEFWMIGYLLIKGVRHPRPGPHIPVATPSEPLTE